MYDAIDIFRVRGSIQGVLSEEKIEGLLDFIPLPNGGGMLMLPIEILIEKNKENRKCGIMVILPLSLHDLRLRTVLSITKAETGKLLNLHPGEVMTIFRKGWGREWKHKIKLVQKGKG